MRQERTVQASIFDLFAGHEIGRELKAMSAWLDDHRELASLVATDLPRHGVKPTGRQGLPAESVLRCALLKQHRQLSYQELAFHLEDSASFRAFARLPQAWSPQKSVLHQTISAIRATTWEQINRTLLTSARATKLERGRVIRLDSTVTAAPDDVCDVTYREFEDPEELRTDLERFFDRVAEAATAAADAEDLRNELGQLRLVFPSSGDELPLDRQEAA
jgi:IS5 family transposase